MTKEELKKQIKKDIKRYRTLQQISKDEEYKFAYSMIADYLEELLELSEQKTEKIIERSKKNE